MVALLVAVLAPLAGATLTLVLPRPVRSAAGGVVAAVTGVGALGLGAQVWRAGAATTTATEIAGLPLALTADGLAAALVAMSGAVGLLASLFAVSHDRLADQAGHRAFWPLWLLLWSGLHVLFLAGDLFTAYLMLELIALSGVALVVLGGDGRTLLAGTRYFFAEFAASATFLLGVAVVWREAGTVVLADLPAELAATSGGRVALGLMTAGLLLKVPLFPLHFWLPGAHWLAPSTVSPVLSAIVVKTAFAVLIRLWFDVFEGAITLGAAQVLGWLGTFAVVWGSVNALRVGPVKLLVAHSTVAQLGFMFLLVPMAHAGAWGGWAGGVVQAIAHALAKAAALMAVAVFVRAAPTDTVDDLGGTAARRPVALFTFGVASLSLVGLPPSGGFVAKWYLLLASFETGQWWWAPVIVVGSLLSAAYLMRVIKWSFAPAPAGVAAEPVRDLREVVALLLALGALALGLRPTELLELLEVGAPALLTGGG